MKAILHSLLSVIGGEAAVRAANFAAILLIARVYGKVELGAYAVSLAVVTVVVMFADNGLQTAAITQVSKENENRNQVIGQLAICKTILLTLAAIVLFGVAGWTKQTDLFVAIGIWVAARTILQSYSQLQMSVLKSVSLAKWIGMIQSAHSAFLLLGIGLAFQLSWSIFSLLAWMTACQLLELLLGTAVLYRHSIRPNWPTRLDFLSVIKFSAPFGIVYGVANLIARLDTIVLSTLVPLEILGAFSAANTILLIVYVCAWLFGSILLPEMVRLSNKPEALRGYASQWARLTFLVSAPCALIISLLAPSLTLTLYGPGFAASGRLGSAMALACPFILLNSVYTTASVAANKRGMLLGLFGATAAATLLLDFYLGRSFGPMGVAVAILIREAGMLAGFLMLSVRRQLSSASLELRASSGGN